MSTINKTGKRRERGFTLGELMVTIAIIGILVAVALPGYNEYLMRAKRAGAKAVLVEIMSREEQYAATNRAYVFTVPPLAACCDAANTSAVESGLGMSIPSDVKATYYFSIESQSVAGGTNNGFMAKATPVPGSSQDADGTLTINQFGLRLPTGKW